MKMTPFKVMLLILLIPIIIFLFLILPLIVYRVRKDMREQREGKEWFSSIVAYSKTDYNFTINEKDYEIVITGYKGGYVFKSPPPIYGLRKKGIRYKSKYFSELGEKYYEFGSKRMIDSTNNFLNSGGTLLLDIIANFGLQPYVLNFLIYDKSKGNDFEKIEEIFGSYGERITYQITDNGWDCGGMGKDFESDYSINYTKNIDCAEKTKDSEYYNTHNYEIIKKYTQKYEEYFMKPRSIETIDWEEYMKIHEIHPIIIFFMDGTEEEKEELRWEIEPYYNKEILDIIIE